MELGPIQKAWIKSLREHPERQMQEQLGKRTPDGGYAACCLGEGLLTLHAYESEYLDHLFNTERNDYLCDGDAMASLKESYEKLGLRDGDGLFDGEELDNIESSDQMLGDASCLAEANDDGYTWPQIADFMEANPKVVFARSV